MSTLGEDEPLCGGGLSAGSSHAQIAAARTKLLQQQKQLDDRIRAVNALSNSIAPINRLPVEIFVEIFRIVQKRSNSEYSEEPRKQLGSWYGLVSVCCAWRTIACATPLLWQTIYVGAELHLGLFQLFLERSATMLLELSFSATRDLEPFLESLKPHRSRLWELDFEWLPRDQSAVVSDFLRNGDMPHLAVLQVAFGKYSWELWTDTPELPEEARENDPFGYIAQGMPLFRFEPQENQYPSLTTLKLRSVVLDNISALAPSVTEVFLSNAICREVPLVRFLESLKDCKKLESLNLSRYRFHDPDLRAWTRDASHPLPQLVLPQTFDCFGMEDVAPYTARFLSALSLPDTADVDITKLTEYYDGEDEFDDPDPDHAPSPLAACLPTVKIGLPLLTSATQAGVSLGIHGADDFQDHFYGSLEEADFSLSSSSRSTNLREALLGVFGNAPLVELKIHGIAKGTVAAADWASILGAFPLLRRLAVAAASTWTTNHTMQDLLKVLASRQPDGAATSPRLRELGVAVSDADDDAEIVALIAVCLKTRKGMGKRLARLRVGVQRLGQSYPLLLVSDERAARYTGFLRSQELVDTVECRGDFNWCSSRAFWGKPIESDEEATDSASAGS